MSYDYEQFVKTVQHKAELSWEDAERAAEATLLTLSERLSGGEVEDIAGQVPAEVRRWLVAEDGAEPFDVAEFLRRVAEREGIDDLDAAHRHGNAVFVALGRSLPRQELDDMKAELPKDFEPLLAGVEPAPEIEPLSIEQFLRRVADRAGVDDEAAWRISEAVLEALAQRLAPGEVEDLEAELPRELVSALERGKTPKAERISLEDFMDVVAERAGISHDQAHEYVPAVFRTLREAVSPKEWHDMTAELPREYQPVLVGS